MSEKPGSGVIGLFDSGIGGITVIKELLRQLPDYDFVYLADTARAPYGDRDRETIRRFVQEDCQFLVQHGAALIVAASNTNSTHRPHSKDVWSISVPVLGTLAPQFSETLKATTKNGNVGILATQATIASGRYQKIVQDAGFVVFPQACSKLVPLIEADDVHGTEVRSVVEEYVAPLLAQDVDTIILGCTHYPIIRDVIAEVVGPSVQLLDPAATCITGLAWYLEQHPEIATSLARTGNHVWYSTKPNAAMQTLAESYLGMRVEWRQVRL